MLTWITYVLQNSFRKSCVLEAASQTASMMMPATQPQSYATALADALQVLIRSSPQSGPYLLANVHDFAVSQA